jgi:hypothetical protein
MCGRWRLGEQITVESEEDNSIVLQRKEEENYSVLESNAVQSVRS